MLIQVRAGLRAMAPQAITRHFADPPLMISKSQTALCAVLGVFGHCVFTPVLLAGVVIPASDSPSWGARASGPASRQDANLRCGRLGMCTPSCLGWTPGRETLLWMVLKRGLAVAVLACLLLHNIGCWCSSSPAALAWRCDALKTLVPALASAGVRFHATKCLDFDITSFFVFLCFILYFIFFLVWGVSARLPPPTLPPLCCGV